LLLKIEGQLANVVDVETVCEVLKFFVIQGRATRDEVMAKFGLAETKQLRPLLATLTSEGLIKAKRGFYPEPKLIQAYKASEGFNFTKLTKVTKAGKEPPKNLGEDKHESEKNDPSFSDLGKLGNLGKMEHLSPIDNG
jgi:transcription initiation factor IIE alpha subunit